MPRGNPNPKTDHLRPPWKKGETGNSRGSSKRQRAQAALKALAPQLAPILEPMKAEMLRELAQGYAHEAITHLVLAMRQGSESAANSILDRAFGKPKEIVEAKGGAFTFLQLVQQSLNVTVDKPPELGKVGVPKLVDGKLTIVDE
jgi:hypothetical protein